MRSFDPSRPDRTATRGQQPRLGFLVGALCLLAMLGVTVMTWPDMVDQLPQEYSRRRMLFEPHKALGNAVAPVVLLIVMALMSLAPHWDQRLSRSSRLILATDPADRRRSLDLALALTAVTLLAVHIVVVAAYLGHRQDPLQLTAWVMSGVVGLFALLVLLGSWPSSRPATGVRPVAAIMLVAALAAAALGVDHGAISIVLSTLALTLGVVAVVMLQARDLIRSGRARRS